MAALEGGKAAARKPAKKAASQTAAQKESEPKEVGLKRRCEAPSPGSDLQPLYPRPQLSWPRRCVAEIPLLHSGIE